MGARPRRSGSAKFTRPSPPKVVPRSANNAWFWLIGNSCPLHSAQPFGAKTKLMILISDRNGSAILYSSVEHSAYGAVLQLENPDVAEMRSVPLPAGFRPST